MRLPMSELPLDFRWQSPQQNNNNNKDQSGRDSKPLSLEAGDLRKGQSYQKKIRRR
jgi:hypothetical protein